MRLNKNFVKNELILIYSNKTLSLHNILLSCNRELYEKLQMLPFKIIIMKRKNNGKILIRNYTKLQSIKTNWNQTAYGVIESCHIIYK